MPPIPKPRAKPKGPAHPGEAGGARHAKTPITPAEQRRLQNPQGTGRPNNAPSGAPAEKRPTGKKTATQKAGKKIRKIYTHPGAVKAEFLLGAVLLLLSPIGNPNVHVDTNYFKRLVAFMVTFMFLFPMGQSSSPAVSRVASGLGGMLVLTMVVYSPSKGFATDFTALIKTVVSKLQPK